MSYFVYVLESKITGHYYVGQTHDLADRLRRHNAGESLSSKAGIPWSLVYNEKFDSRASAMRRENQIKKRGIARYLRGVAQPG